MMLMKSIPHTLEERKFPLTGKLLFLEKATMLQVAQRGLYIQRRMKAVVNVCGHKTEGVLKFLFRDWKIPLLIAMYAHETRES
mmetsp:Transcript_23657/g.49559  ORF Transcript_23657/g.49559 Transcript_23657/m.49559 type:complete len:83 (+) Transcript_23657:568-816(+)